jgi:sister-chromatid-cohesion protein PDS5
MASHDSTSLQIGRYIDFFVNLVATADNISLLFHIASRAKTVQDAEGDAFSDVRLQSCIVIEY